LFAPALLQGRPHLVLAAANFATDALVRTTPSSKKEESPS
jgi:hypothetical protein